MTAARTYPPYTVGADGLKRVTASTPPSPRKPARQVALPKREAVRYYTVAEVALEMRVSNMTVYRLYHQGWLAGVLVGRSIRIPEASVVAYLGRGDDE